MWPVASASRKEFAHYLNISIKSSSEVDYQLEYARDLGVLAFDVWKPLAKEVVEIRKMLTALRRAVLNSIDPPNKDSEDAKGKDADRQNARPQDPTPEDTGPDA